MKIPVFLRYAFLMIMVVFLSDRSLHLFVNQFHTPFFDFFFKYLTYLGDGLIFIPLIILYFFLHRPTAFRLMIAGILTLVFTALLKQVIFDSVPRPLEYFGAEKLYLVKNVTMAHWNSFPSGHTTTAFVIFALLKKKYTSKIFSGAFFFLAVLSGFSRVYLSQHFLLDIFVGAFLGLEIAQLSIVLYEFIGLFFTPQNKQP